MIQAELKGFRSSDAHVPDLELRNFAPDDPTNFSVYVEATIGPAGTDGEDVFGFIVCSARWLVEHPPPKRFQFIRLLLLESWDYQLLESVLTDFCNHAVGHDWNAVAEKLSRYSYWEFEDYVE